MTKDARSLRLSPGELRQFRWFLGNLAALLASASAAFLSPGDWPFAALAGTVALASLLFPSLPARLPRFAHLLAFPAAATFFCWDLWTGAEWLPALARLDLLLLCYRCLGYRGRREDLQVLLLGFLLVVAAGVLTVDFSFVVLLGLFVICALAMLHSLAAEEGSGPAETSAGHSGAGAPGWPAGFRLDRLVGRLFERLHWRLVALGFLLFSGTIAVTALLFFAIPRFQFENSLFLDRFFPRKARTGFSENVRFGSVAEITLDDRLALSVDPGTARPLPSSLYFRMLALDEYGQDGSFRLSGRGRLELAASERNASLLRGTVRSSDERAGDVWTLYLEAGVSRFLPLPGGFGSLRLRDPNPLQYSPRLGVVSLRSEPLSMTAYRLESPVSASSFPDSFFEARLRAGRHDAEGRALGGARLCLELPADVASQLELRGLLVRWGLTETRSAEDFARLAAERLRSSHRYSLSPSIPDGPGDPLVRWLASTRPGHCELFAGSFALLARAASYPARLVVGFRGGSWNDYSKSLTVRNSDAHAWCEIWDASAGVWRRVDPTPGADLGERGLAGTTRAAPVERGWSARLDGLRVAWYRHVVNFDRQSQIATVQGVRELAVSAGARFSAELRSLADASRRLLFGAWSTSDLGRLGKAFALPAALLAVWLLLRGTRNLAGFQRGEQGKTAATRAEAGRWLRRLEARPGSGLANPASLAPVREELLRLRYGEPSTWPEPRRVFRCARRLLR